MEKFLIDIFWKDEEMPLLHLRDCKTANDEYVLIPNEIDAERIDKKVCIGSINPFTRQYISCNKLIDEGDIQCNECKYMYDFYKCVKCHGTECYAKNEDVLKYCNSQHYVYLAYFNNDKIKVGTASKAKRYERLLEQGALFSVLIAKTSTGKIAREIEKEIIDHGVNESVTINYKMKNLASSTVKKSIILKKLLDEYKHVLEILPNIYKNYLITPEFVTYDNIQKRIEDTMLEKSAQLDLFDTQTLTVKKYTIKKDLTKIRGKYLFVVGNILALENNDEIELLDIRKMKGWLYDFKNTFTPEKIKNIGGK